MKLPEHGANPEQLVRQMGSVTKAKLIDFSTNTSVIQHPLLKKQREKSFLYPDLATYPDPEQHKMRELLAGLYHMDRESFWLTNGANEAIYLIASYCMNKTVGIVVPTYPEYEKALNVYGAHVVPIPNDTFEAALEEEQHPLWKEMEELEVLFLCNPNNPTGKYYDTENLESLRLYMQQKALTLIVDESYIDFVQTKAVYGYSKPTWDMEQTVILRSLTKNFQLAGIRIAYVMSSPTWIQKIVSRQPTWSVNSIAMHLAEQLITDRPFIRAMQAYYHQETQRFWQGLMEMNVKVVPTDVHYFLIQTDDDLSLIKWLLDRGIVVRHTNNHRGLDGRYIRVATKTVDDNNYFMKMMKERCNAI